MTIPKEHDTASLWHDEYRKKGIPSSFRHEPSGALTSSLDLLQATTGLRGGTAIDIGCGSGRNSLELARRGYEVYSIDIVAAAVNSLEDEANLGGLKERVHAFCQNVTARWPAPKRACDLALDTFCFKHLISRDDQTSYVRELQRVLKPGGFYLLTLAGMDDGYYGPLLDDSPDPSRSVIVDPANGISSILYQRTDIEHKFAETFEVFHYEHKLKTGVMHGITCPRSTHCFIMRRRM